MMQLSHPDDGSVELMSFGDGRVSLFCYHTYSCELILIYGLLELSLLFDINLYILTNIRLIILIQ